MVRPPEGSPFAPEEQVIVGNVVLYGATGGEVFVSGLAGERFCVRNSGALAVVEGVGDHGCEYMTGGRVVVLGPVGRNFAAGMSGGIAYVHDPEATLAERLNPELVDLEPLDEEDKAFLATVVRRHQEETGSPLAARLLEEAPGVWGRFVKVMPRDYRRVLEATREAEAKGQDPAEAVMALVRA